MNSQDIYNLHEAYIGVYADLDEERAEGVKEYQPRKRNPLPKEKALSGEKGDRSGWNPDDKKFSDWKLRVTPGSGLKKKSGETETVSQRMNREHPYKNRLMGPLGREQGSRISSEVTRVLKGKGEARATVSLAPKTRKEEFELWVNNLLDEGYDLSGYTWEGLYEEYILNEAYDLYDVILSHLINEGYADTQEQAEAIMVNMSEEWRESIFEGLVDTVASGAGTVVGTAQRAAREIPKYVKQKVDNVAGSYEYARQKANGNLPSGGMNTTSKPRSREFTNISTPVNKTGDMKNPGPNFGRG